MNSQSALSFRWNCRHYQHPALCRVDVSVDGRRGRRRTAALRHGDLCSQFDHFSGDAVPCTSCIAVRRHVSAWLPCCWWHQHRGELLHRPDRLGNPAVVGLTVCYGLGVLLLGWLAYRSPRLPQGVGILAMVMGAAVAGHARADVDGRRRPGRHCQPGCRDTLCGVVAVAWLDFLRDGCGPSGLRLSCCTGLKRGDTAVLAIFCSCFVHCACRPVWLADLASDPRRRLWVKIAGGIGAGLLTLLFASPRLHGRPRGRRHLLPRRDGRA